MGERFGYPEHEVLWITDFELHANSFATLISMARMQSAPKEDSKSFDVPTRD